MWVCRLPVHIDPAGCTVFTGICGEFVTAQWADVGRRPLQQVSALPVGADDSVRPQNAVVFSEIYGEFATSSRADVGIGPYRARRRFAAAHRAGQSPAPTKAWANSYCFADFERKLGFPHQLPSKNKKRIT